MPTTEQARPLLLPGMRMSREEFLRRWEATPELKHAELINGVVYMPSPISNAHGDHDGLITAWVVQYGIATPGCRGASNKTWLLDKNDAPEPDASLHILPEYGGNFREEDGLAAGVPELIIEVSLSSSHRDLKEKLDLYQRCGVQEYIVVLVEQEELRWHRLDGGSYRLLEPGEEGVNRSEVFPGLWLDPAALFRLDGARVLQVLNVGLASAEHAEFVTRLAAARH